MATYLGAKPGLAGAKRPSATANAHLMRLGSQWRLRLEAPIAGAPAVLHPAPVSLQSQRFGTLHRRGACVASAAAADPDPQRAASATPPHASSTTPGAPQPTLSAPAAAATSAAVTVPLLDCVFAREEEDDGEDFAGSLPPDVRVLEAADSIGAGASATGPAAAAQPHAKSQSVIASGTSSCCGGGNGCGVAAAGPVAPRRVPFVVAAASVVTETRPGAAVTEDGGAAAVAPWDEAAEQPQTVPGEKFDWYRQWYPVAPLDTMDPARPHPFTLLGQELVLWRDGGGTWRAFRDACPHRLAPLSEGRIEADGTLLCAYHGWRFNGSGGCTTIPNFTDEAAHAKATASRRACATAHPTRHLGGLLWVWGSSGPGAEAESAAKQPVLPPEIQEDGTGAPGVDAPGWSFRDLPYGHVYFIENVVDPAHVPVSHHKVAGDRYRDLKKSFSMELSRPVTKDGGFEVSIPKSWRSDVQTSSTGFYPPSHVRIQQNHHNGGTTILALYSTPTVPGWTRHVGMQLLKKAPDSSAKGSGIAFFGLPLPRWLAHLAGALFLHQDMVFLHHQERTVTRDQVERLQRAAAAAAAAGSSSAGQQQQQQDGQQGATAAAATAGAGGDGRALPPPKYYMPTSVDTGVTAWRHWLATFSDGDVPWAPGTPPLGPRERDPAKLFDTWHTHTSKCTVCLAALERMRLVRTIAIAAAAAAILAATVTAAARAAAAASAAAAAAVAAAGATAAGAAAAAGGSGGLWGAIVAAAQAFACGEVGVLALVAALAAAVAAVTVKLEALMHRYDYNHADNV